MGDELGRATDIDRLLVFSGQPARIFTPIGTEDFWSCHNGLQAKNVAKKM